MNKLEWFCPPSQLSSSVQFSAILDVPSNGDLANLNFNLGQSASSSRTWRIKITQLICGLAPPSCCFQYYTGTTGQIFSFNWQNTARPLHLANQNYQICIRQEKGKFPLSTPTRPILT